MMAEKVNKLMTFFVEIMNTLNEKKSLLIKTYLDRVREVMKQLSFTPDVGSGQLVVQKRTSCNVVKVGEQGDIKVKEKIEVDTFFPSTYKRPYIEERPLEKEATYTPSNSTHFLGEEKLTIEKMEQLGSQSGFFITTTELE